MGKGRPFACLLAWQREERKHAGSKKKLIFWLDGRVLVVTRSPFLLRLVTNCRGRAGSGASQKNFCLVGKNGKFFSSLLEKFFSRQTHSPGLVCSEVFVVVVILRFFLVFAIFGI